MIVINTTKWSRPSKSVLLQIDRIFSTNSEYIIGYSKKYAAPSSSWYLSELKVLAEANEYVISSKEVDKLADLAKINLSLSKISKDDVLCGVNIILNCVNSLNSNVVAGSSYEDKQDGFHHLMNYSNLRKDLAFNPSKENSDKILKIAPFVHQGYFAVPKIKEENR